MTAALIVLPLSGGVSTRIHATRTPRRKSSFVGEFLEYTDTLPNLYEQITTIKATIKRISPSTLDLAKNTLSEGNESMNSFAKTLEKMRVTKNSLSSDPTKTELAKHFQGQLSTLVVSTEERLKEYREALSELDQRIRTMQLADTTQAHPPLQRQTGLQTLSHPPTPWQNCCVIL